MEVPMLLDLLFKDQVKSVGFRQFPLATLRAGGLILTKMTTAKLTKGIACQSRGETSYLATQPLQASRCRHQVSRHNELQQAW